MKIGDLVMPELPSNLGREVAQRATTMPATLKHQLESKLGTDLSGVRVHVSHLPTLAGADSFTKGSDIHFAPGKYNPYSEEGRNLIGHELAHVVQQTQGRVASQMADMIGLEGEADRMASKVLGR